MGFLPALRYESDRWWLPCGRTSMQILSKLLISAARATPVDVPTRLQLIQSLHEDPSLLIFTAIRCKHPHPTLEVLADWWIHHAVDCYAEGDAFIGSPGSDEELQSQWRKLRDYFHTLPLNQWMDQADLWLCLTGPTPPAAWKRQWPQIDFQSVPPSATTQSEENPAHILQQLAILAKQHRVMEESFSDQLQLEKLDSLKQLAYGLSHEINNPLANISTRAQQLQRDEADPSRTATLQRIVDQVYRAHEMIADLMFYANPPRETLQSCRVPEILQTVAESFHDEAERQSIRIEVAVPDDDIFADLDAKMVSEALRVMIQNAIDAIGSQGTIVLSIVPGDGEVMIHVADSGPGLSDEARDHAFDPYFSGREAGRGLGLGLCRAYRVAKLHRGEIHLTGGPAGCVATLSLPMKSS